ncbi:MAG: hypothetical protein JXA09_07985 [Anaerolineae bacterium]|nr:hypothetical protein [Anaerolineae bacterium]
MEPPRSYDRDTLYAFMNGAADLYFTYGFVSLAVGEYEHAQGGTARVEVYRTASDADAYGLFAYNAYGDPVDLGADGRGEAGERLAFWQRQTFVQLLAQGGVDPAALRALGAAIAAALPAGGDRPAVVRALPDRGLDPASVRFFRQQMALEQHLWLGAEDVLELGPDVEGALAAYTLDGARVTLLVVVYPEAGRAERARARLAGGEIGELVAARVAGRALGAVFGAVDAQAAETLIERALAAAG